MSKRVKAVAFWLVILVASLVLWQIVKPDHNQRESLEISYSEFLSRVDAGAVSKVVITGSQITGTGQDAQQFRVQGPTYQAEMLNTLRSKNVEIWFRDTTGGWPAQLLGTWSPLILLATLWFFMIRQMGRRQKAQREAGSVQNIENIG